MRYDGVQATKTFAKLKGVMQAALAKVQGCVKAAIKMSAPLTDRQRYQQRTGRDPLRCPHEHAGVESFEATSVATLEDGTRVSSGPWKEARTDDPRHFVIVQAAAGKTLVYWGTPQVQDALEAHEWPGGYRERNERQEHRFKDMIDHGALNTIYGRKKMLGADRQQQ